MNVFITIGTNEVLNSIKIKHKSQNMILMNNPLHSLLLHETNHNTVFQTARRYKTINNIGDWKNKGFVAFNHLPVTEEGKPLFEHHIKKQIGSIEKTEGFILLRTLKPEKTPFYIVLTVWEDELKYQNWFKSSKYSEIFNNNKMELGIESGSVGINSIAPYITKYNINNENE